MSCTSVSLRQLVETYLPDRTRSGSSSDYKELNSVINKLNNTYTYRNYDYVPERNLNEAVVGRPETICHEHYYSSFTDFLSSNDRNVNSKSLSDIYDASQEIAFCTCDGRNISKCSCVYVKTENPTCDCYTRTAITCTCFDRYPGKYAPSCYCDSRYAECPCVARAYTYYCDCDGRCSCHTVSEYTMTKRDEIAEPCDCVSRTYSVDCACHEDNRAIYNCFCQNRTYKNKSNAPCGWDSYCGGSHMMKQVERCQCDVRESAAGNVLCSTVTVDKDTGEITQCIAHSTSDGYMDTSCTCVERTGTVLCRCDVRNFYGAVI